MLDLLAPETPLTFHLHSIELLTIASIKYSMLFSLLLFLIQFP